jgi:rod shape determining protein RodA
VFERRLSSHLDWPLLAAVLALAALGVAMIYSTTGGASREYWTQIYAIGLGLVAMVACLSVDYRSLVDKSHFVYLGLLVTLLAVLLIGEVRGGSRRWLDLGPFNLQPSEFMKAGVALVLAKLLGDSRRGDLSNQDLFLATVLTLVPFMLIARQPDLGTAVTLLPVVGAIVFGAGLSMRYLAIGALAALILAPIAWTFALEDYQKSRIETFLDPEQDARGGGYQQIQARITVGSGGVLGKGFMQGTQGQLRFLPVATTTSSSRCWPRNRASPASSWRWRCICSSSCGRSTPPGCRRIASARSWCWACWPASPFRWSTTSPCRRVWRRSRACRCRS